MTSPDQDARHTARMVRKKAVIDARIAAAQDARGVLLVNTGNGKGKSSAAFGVVARALGHGQRVAVVQFVKTRSDTGEQGFFARYAAANPTASDDTVAAYVREACALGDTASVTVTSADAPSKPVTLKSGDKSVTARYAREKVTVKVVEDVSCIFPLKSLGVSVR